MAGISGYKAQPIKFTALPALAQGWRDRRRTPPSAFPRPADISAADLARRIEYSRERACFRQRQNAAVFEADVP